MSIDRAKALKSAQKYLAKGQLDRAIVEYEKVVALDPKDPRSLLKLGDLYTRVGDSKNAIATYRKVALQYGDEGFFLKAVAVHKQILKLEPGNLDAWEKLGEMYEALTLTSDAVATYEQVADAAARAGKNDIVLRALGHASEIEPENIAAAIRYAEALSKADKIDAAVEAFRRGADLLKRDGRIEDYMKVTERLLFHSHEDIERARELAELYLDRDRAKQALAHLQTCFKHDPKDPGTLLLLGRAFEQLDQGPKASSVYRELARVHGLKKETAEELAALDRLLHLEPRDAPALRRKAELESELGDEDVIVVDEASAASPRPRSSRPPVPGDEVNTELEVARLLAECEVFERYRLRDRVLAQLKKIVSIAPKHVVAREKLAAALTEASDPAAVEHWLTLADLVAATNPVAGRGYVERAAKLVPGNARVGDRLKELTQLAQQAAQSTPAGSHSRQPATSQLATAEHLATAEDDDEVMFVDEDEDEASFADIGASSPAPAPAAELDDDEPELELDAEQDADELGISDEDLVESDSLPPPAAVPPRRSTRPPRPASMPPAARPAHFDGGEEELPARVGEALEEADFYLSQELVEEAREVLFDALGDEPGHPALLAKLRDLDAIENAKNAPEPVIDDDDDGPEISTEPTSLFLEDQSFALAEKLAEESVGLSTPSGPVDFSDVLAQFKEGVRRQVDKADTATHYDLGIAYMEMGLHAEAIEEFKLCLQSPDKECTAHTMIALSYVANGEMAPAIEHFKLALGSPGATGQAELDLWFEIGNAHELGENTNEALVWYEKVEERDPKFRDVSQRIERIGTVKTQAEEGDEFDEMFDNMIAKE